MLTYLLSAAHVDCHHSISDDARHNRNARIRHPRSNEIVPVALPSEHNIGCHEFVCLEIEFGPVYFELGDLANYAAGVSGGLRILST